MQNLRRNLSRFHYALYASKSPVYDEYGNLTGEYSIQYSEPVEAHGNVSAARGEATTRQFGEDEGYDRVIVLDDPTVPIDTSSVLWVDAPPEYDDEGKVSPYDYIVKKVAVSLNSVSIAVSKVTVRHG